MTPFEGELSTQNLNLKAKRFPMKTLCYFRFNRVLM